MPAEPRPASADPLRLVCILDVGGPYKAGDPRPAGYLAFHEWADAQIEAGLEQRRCWKCGLWRFPQEECCGPAPAGRSESKGTPCCGAPVRTVTGFCLRRPSAKHGGRCAQHKDVELDWS